MISRRSSPAGVALLNYTENTNLRATSRLEPRPKLGWTELVLEHLLRLPLTPESRGHLCQRQRRPSDGPWCMFRNRRTPGKLLTAPLLEPSPRQLQGRTELVSANLILTLTPELRSQHANLPINSSLQALPRPLNRVAHLRMICKQTVRMLRVRQRMARRFIASGANRAAAKSFEHSWAWSLWLAHSVFWLLCTCS